MSPVKGIQVQQGYQNPREGFPHTTEPSTIAYWARLVIESVLD